ncbi:uncharacterized protein LOC128236195 [Mya arenaria]|uniref:uncharacterized protein LOC128236195 n=1 Tax=Mya arenaria TaxID=6604 RepID=UPI0022E396AD|nr:uncharacterized protein LOC128236195 [Mya arenaria]
MRLYWTVPILVAMHMRLTFTAVANLPEASGETHVRENGRQRKQNPHRKDSSNTYTTEWPDDVQLGCKELRAKRYISDGFCTSLKAIKEVVCAGQCMPIKEQNLPWWAEFTKYWAKPKFKEWRCVEAVTKLKKVQLICENGETRTYKIKIVKSCRCKSYEREPNRTDLRKGSSGRGSRESGDSEKKTDKLQKKRERDQKKQQRRKLFRKCRNLPKEERRKCRKQVQKELSSSTSDKSNKHSLDVQSNGELDLGSTRRHNVTLTFNESPDV